ncbi:MAG: ankyrin repeat domain-containing protein [Candidatus Hydrogenedentes bacterium]|nr:ankyrin repeat domain-containing protein [Candidatus Hydrogenedentota bacterium]
MKYAYQFAVLALLAVASGCGAGGGKNGMDATEPIYKAAQQGDAATVAAEIRRGRCKISTPDAKGRTLLHYAVIGNQADLVKRLVGDYGADVGAKDADGRSPISYAEEAGNKEMVELLRREGG